MRSLVTGIAFAICSIASLIALILFILPRFGILSFDNKAVFYSIIAFMIVGFIALSAGGILWGWRK